MLHLSFEDFPRACRPVPLTRAKDQHEGVQDSPWGLGVDGSSVVHPGCSSEAVGESCGSLAGREDSGGLWKFLLPGECARLSACSRGHWDNVAAFTPIGEFSGPSEQSSAQDATEITNVDEIGDAATSDFTDDGQDLEHVSKEVSKFCARQMRAVVDMVVAELAGSPSYSSLWQDVPDQLKTATITKLKEPYKDSDDISYSESEMKRLMEKTGVTCGEAFLSSRGR